MRISTSTMFSTSAYNMSSLQSSLNTLQTELSTQQSVNTPADNPVAAASIVQLNQADGINTQYVTNCQSVDSYLSISSSQLTNVNNLLTSIKSLAIQAGNTTLNASNLSDVQSQLQQDITQMASYANATDGQGNYLYGGTQSSSPPFSLDSTYTATYNGDTGQRSVAISSSESIQVTDPGSAIFGNSTSSTAVFDTLKLFNDTLTAGTSSATYTSNMNDVINQLTQESTVVNQGLASVGSRQQEADAMQSMNTNLGVAYKTGISNLQSVNLPSAISNFTQTQTALQYSQLVFTKVSGLSLFNYMS